MRRSALIAAVSGVLALSAAANAAFTVSAVANGAVVNGRQRVDLIALNDGVGTGTKLQAANFSYTTSTGTRVFFGVQDLLPVDGDGNAVPDGTFDTVNLYNNPSVQPSTTQLRFSSAPGAATAANPAQSDHTYQNFNPSTAQNAAGTPYNGGITAFSGAYAVLGAAAPVANGTGGGSANGASFGRLFIDSGGSFTIAGTIAGDTGTPVPFTASFGSVVVANATPVVQPVAATPVVFGQITSNGQTFSVNITATDANTNDILSLAVGALPTGISNIAVTGSGTSPRTFTVTGLVNASRIGQTVSVPFSVSDNGSPVASAGGTFNLVVTPEPASLAALAGAAGLGLIRRRK